MEETLKRLTVAEVKSDLCNFRANIRDDLRKDLTNIRARWFITNQKTLTDRVWETKHHTAGMKKWTLKEVLSQSLQAQNTLHMKPTDLEACSRQNNICIYGIQEGLEGNNVQNYIHKMLLKRSWIPLIWVELRIQQCHRAFSLRPPKKVQPQPIVVCFQEFWTKNWCWVTHGNRWGYSMVLRPWLSCRNAGKNEDFCINEDYSAEKGD